MQSMAEHYLAQGTEQSLLDLEHEVFLSLCGEQETHARIEATLQRSKK